MAVPARGSPTSAAIIAAMARLVPWNRPSSATPPAVFPRKFHRCAREQSPLVRLSLLGQPLAGRPITFQVYDAGVKTQRVFVPDVFSLSRFWQYVVWEFASLWLLLFAVLIAWRRPYVDNNLLLATLLASTAVGISSALLLFAWPWPWPYVALSLIGQSEPISIALWATLASAFARPLSPLRRFALGACYAIVAIWIVFGNGTPDRVPGLAPLLGDATANPTVFIGAPWITTSITAVLAAEAWRSRCLSAEWNGNDQDVPKYQPSTLPLASRSSWEGSNGFKYLQKDPMQPCRGGYAKTQATIVLPLVLTRTGPLNRRIVGGAGVHSYNPTVTTTYSLRRSSSAIQSLKGRMSGRRRLYP